MKPEKRVVIYCRVSSAEQVKGTSLTHQETMCREYCRRENLDVIRIFSDEGASAKTADRAEFQAMVRFCAVSDIDTAVVYKLDRFARNSYDFAMFQATLAKYGTTIASATEPMEDNPAGKLMQTILSGIAQFDNEVRAERSRSGMVDIARRGGWTFKPPFGMILQRDKQKHLPVLAPDPEIAPAIAQMFEMIANDAMRPSYAREWLSRKLNTEISIQTTRKILHNCVYAGIIKNKLTDSLPIKAAFPGIVDIDVWEIVQMKIKPRKEREKPPNPEFLLQGVLICGDCGKNITASYSRGSRGRYYGYYHCRKKCKTRVRVEVVESNFFKMLEENQHKLQPVMELLKIAVNDVWLDMYNTAQRQEKENEKKIKRLSKRRNKLIDMRLDGEITDEMYRIKSADIETSLALAKSENHDNALLKLDAETVVNLACDWFSDLPTLICRTPQKDLKTLIKTLIGDLKLAKTGELSNSSKSSVFSMLDAVSTGGVNDGTANEINVELIPELIIGLHKLSHLIAA